MNSKNLRTRENCSGLKILFKLNWKYVAVFTNVLICNGIEFSKFEWRLEDGNLNSFFFITNLNSSGVEKMCGKLNVSLGMFTVLRRKSFFLEG
jgi:hypothetical protein